MTVHPSRSDGGDHAPVEADDVADRLHAAHPEFDEVPVLEDDETVPPRPEEFIADAARD